MSADPLPTTAKKNVETIARVERELHGRRTRVELFGDRVARFFGSWVFIAAHAAALAAWAAWNLGAVPGAAPFDPYPFPFLGLVVGVEFIFLTSFVLMNQSHQSRRQEHWGHLTLQVCLLAEQENTKAMQMLQAFSRHLGVEAPSVDEESTDLARATPVAALVKEIEKARDTGDGPAARP